MNYLYLFINLATLFFPFILSFDKKVAFYKQWKSVFLSIIATSLIFIPWDIYFTHQGFWGFNSTYLIGINIFNLPLEEILFFITVPYAFLFILACVRSYFPNLGTTNSRSFSYLFTISIFILCSVLLIKFNNPYSLSVFVGVPLASLLVFIIYKKSIFDFLVSYLLVLLPFFLVNGILTGQFTTDPVVWYSEQSFSGIRLGQIPMEDLFYNYILCCLLVLFKKNNQLATH